MPSDINLITPVVLAGGKGTRLWPLSRNSRPKQFLPLVGELSLFQQTLQRVADRSLYGPAVVVTNEDYRFMVAEQAERIGVDLQTILLEPVARNTAAAIAAAASLTAQNGPAQLVHVLPSDHQIDLDDSYFEAVRSAAEAAHDGRLVTFGITPTEPATGFGYIDAPDAGKSAVAIKRFVEKPDRDTAISMLERGDYYWNSGMFLFQADTFLEECGKLAPDVRQAAEAAVAAATPDLGFLRLDADSFSEAPDISVDYAVFEKTDRAAMVRLDVPWSDLGAWDAVWKEGRRRDSDGNSIHGRTYLPGTKNSLVHSERDLVVVNGLDDVAVIASEDAVYVGRLSQTQNVGDVVKHLKQDPATEALTQSHRTSYRPWGGYTLIDMGERFQVKRLFVKPGKRLSLQKHHHRSEHWVVVRGTAEVTIDEEIKIVAENESVYLPRGAVHRLANPGKILLELIEVQTGPYLGEDDIIRIEDEFGRD